MTVVFITSGTTWTVPSDWSSTNTIEVVGGGGGAGGGLQGSHYAGGGGGGAYSKIVNLTLTPGASITIQVGSGGSGKTGSADTAGVAGGDTWFNGASLGASSVGAKGGGGGGVGVPPAAGAGGAAASGVGTTKFSGGSGGGSGGNGMGSGGGAAGPTGNGAAGAQGAINDSNNAGGAGGGGANGGSAGNVNSGNSGGVGGNNSGGSGGGAANGGAGSNGGGGGGANRASNNPGGAGGTQNVWDATHGPGGGGGGGGSDAAGANGTIGGAGGVYGGGGGAGGNGVSTLGDGANGAQGLIVVTYTPTLFGWQRGVDDFTPKPPARFQGPAALALTPATLPPRIAGMAFEQQLDSYPPRRWYLQDAPASGRSAPSQLIGVLWANWLDVLPTPPPKQQPAAAGALTPASLPPVIAGMAWFEPPDAFEPRRWYLQDAPANGQPAPTQLIGVPWANWLDILPLPPPKQQPNMAAALTPATLPPLVAGMAWFEPPPEVAFSGRKAQTSDPAPVPPAPGVITWSFVASDTIWLRGAPLDNPPALGRMVTASTVGISGIAFFEPPDQDRPARKINGEAPPAIALTPATLPPIIAGVAWFEPPDAFEPRRWYLQDAPGYGREIVSVVAPPQGWLPQSFDPLTRKPLIWDWPSPLAQIPPTQLVGVTWAMALDLLPKAAKTSAASPAFVAAFGMAVAPLAWLSRPIDLQRKAAPSIDLPVAAMAPAAAHLTGVPFVGGFDALPRGPRALTPAIGIALTPATLPPRIAGIGWFAPADELPRWYYRPQPGPGFVFDMIVRPGSLLCAVSIQVTPALAAALSTFSAVTGSPGVETCN